MWEAIRTLHARIRGLAGRRSVEEAFDEEAAAHLDLLTDRFVRQGMTPRQARAAAQRQFGGLSQLQDSLRDQRSYPFLDSLRRDVVLSLRQIRTAPRFTAVAALALGLGIGSSTAMFSIVNAVLLRPLPYPDDDRLVWAGEVMKGSSTDEVTLTPDFLEWRRQSRVFTGMAAYNTLLRTLMENGEATQLRTVKASAALLPVLKTEPLIGRPFLPSEDRKGHDQVAILSYHLWQQAFAGDRTIIGRRITLDDGEYEVVGVLRPDFRFPALQPVDLMTPLGKDEERELTRDAGATTIVHDVIARLAPAVSLGQARAEMQVIQANLAVPSFLRRTQISVRVMPLRERFAGSMRFALITLLCAVGCVLLLVCANVANLLLGRAESRRKEMAIRGALGASRGRIVQQLLVESLMLASLGCGLGLVVAFWACRLLVSMVPQSIAGTPALPLDLRVLGFAVLSAVFCALVFGLGPALMSADVSESRSIPGGRHKSLWLSALASLQMAIAIVLLAGGGLMLRSFWRLRYQDLGFPPSRVVTVSINLSHARYPSADRQIVFLDAALAGLKHIPGVEEAGFGLLPPGEGHATNGFGIEGRQWPAQGRRPVARQYSVSPNFFRMLGVRLVKGREFKESDAQTGLPVAMVNDAFARSQFPVEDPLGHRVRFEANTPWRTIVGVVSDIKTAGLANTAEPAIFAPYRQSGFVGGEGAGFLIRTAADVASLAPEVRKQVARADPQQPVIRMETIEQRLTESVAGPRLAAILLGCFGALGLLVAAFGLHSVMFALVRSRFREIGIRLAMGGQPRDMIRLVLGHSLVVMVIGLTAGVVCALLLSRTLASLLYGVSGTDVPTFAASVLLLLLTGLAASWLPARQASRVDPMETLRND